MVWLASVPGCAPVVARLGALGEDPDQLTFVPATERIPVPVGLAWELSLEGASVGGLAPRVPPHASARCVPADACGAMVLIGTRKRAVVAVVGHRPGDAHVVIEHDLGGPHAFTVRFRFTPAVPEPPLLIDQPRPRGPVTFDHTPETMRAFGLEPPVRCEPTEARDDRYTCFGRERYGTTMAFPSCRYTQHRCAILDSDFVQRSVDLVVERRHGVVWYVRARAVVPLTDGERNLTPDETAACFGHCQPEPPQTQE